MPEHILLMNIAIFGGLVCGITVFIVAYQISCYFLKENVPFYGRFKNNRAEHIALICVCIMSIIMTYIVLSLFLAPIQYVSAGVFVYLLLLLAIIDFRTQLLPDIITRPLILLGIMQGYFGLFSNLYDSILGSIIGYWLLWGLNFAYRRIRGTDGMGYGDFKLLAAIGAWVGYKMLPLVILISSNIGILFALLMIKLTKSNFKTPTPFGPALVFAGIISLLYGHNIIDWYMELLYNSVS